jgi:hypothetical protein
METKFCNGCNLTKPMTEFHFVKSRNGYHHRCNTCRKRERREQFLRNKDVILQQSRSWKLKNRDRKHAVDAEYRANNKEKEQKRHAEYEARPEVKQRRSLRARERREKELLFYAAHRCRATISNTCKAIGNPKRKPRTQKLLGCTYTQFLCHLKINSRAELEGMHIDHICPISRALTEDEVYKLNHYSNLRIITAAENLAKSDHWSSEGAMLHLILLGREWPDPSIKELDNSTVV